jgi:hypothetical protein
MFAEVVGAVQSLGAAVTAASSSFTSLVQGGATIISTMRQVAGGMDQVQAKAAALKIGEAFTTAGASLQALGQKIVVVGQNLEQFGTAGQAAGKAIEGIGTAVSTAGGYIKDFSGQASQLVLTLAAMPGAIAAVTAAVGLLRTGLVLLTASMGPWGIVLLAAGAALASLLAVLSQTQEKAAEKIEPKVTVDTSSAMDELHKLEQQALDLDAEIEKKKKLNIDTADDEAKLRAIYDQAAALKEKLEEPIKVTDNNTIIDVNAKIKALQAQFDDGKISITEFIAKLKELNTASLPTAKDFGKQYDDGKISLQQYIAKLQELSAATAKATAAAGLTAQQLRQAWQDGIISLDQYKSKLDALSQAKPPTSKDLFQMWQDGIISLDQYKSKLQELYSLKPGGINADELRYLWQTGMISLDQYKSKLEALSAVKVEPKIAPPDLKGLQDAGKEVTDLFNKIAELQQKKIELQAAHIDHSQVDKDIADLQKKFDDLQHPPPPAPVPPPDTTQAESAWERFKQFLNTPIDFGKLFDMSAKADEFDQSLNKMQTEAETTGQQIDDALKIKPEIEDPSGAGGFSDLVQAAEKAANEVEAVFQNIKPEFQGDLDFGKIVDAAEKAAKEIEDKFNDIKPEFKGSLDFDKLVDQARMAAIEIEGAFQSIHPEFTGSIDFNNIIVQAQNAAQQVAQAFSFIVIPPPQPPDFSGVINAAQQAAEQIAAIFADVLSQVSTASGQIQDAVSQAGTSLQTAQQSATDAAQAASEAADSANAAVQSANAAADAAAQAAASAAAAAQSAGGHAGGGFISGPGSGTSDSILARLSNGEFGLRAAAVAYYGASFFDLFNNMRFPLGGFRDGGLNQISFMPRITLPAFAGGGLVSTTQQSTRVLNLTIGTQTYKGLIAPEDTAQALERAAIARQASSLGIRPGWNK